MFLECGETIFFGFEENNIWGCLRLSQVSVNVVRTGVGAFEFAVFLLLA